MSDIIAKYGRLSIDDMLASREPYLTVDEMAALPPATRYWVENNWPPRDYGGGRSNPNYHANAKVPEWVTGGGRVWLADDPSVAKAYRELREAKERMFK